MISKQEMLREQIVIAIDGHDAQDAVDALIFVANVLLKNGGEVSVSAETLTFGFAKDNNVIPPGPSSPPAFVDPKVLLDERGKR